MEPATSMAKRRGPLEAPARVHEQKKFDFGRTFRQVKAKRLHVLLDATELERRPDHDDPHGSPKKRVPNAPMRGSIALQVLPSVRVELRYNEGVEYFTQ